MLTRLFACFTLLALCPMGTAHAGTLNIATWNVFDLPEYVFPVESYVRMAQATAAMQQAYGPLDTLDAIILNELYAPKDRRVVLDDLSALGFRYQAELTSRDPRDFLSLPGTVIASRWPIQQQSSIIFRNVWHGLDGFTLKGALYAKLLKDTDGHPEAINLFATHFYNGQAGKYDEAKQLQADALARFIWQTVERESEITVVAGDLNTPWSSLGPDIMPRLRAHPVTLLGPLAETFPGSQHFLAGDPRQSAQQRCSRPRSTGLQNGKWIDYVVAVRPGAAPTTSFMKAYETVAEPYLFADIEGCWTDVLSDHHMVVGSFFFQ